MAEAYDFTAIPVLADVGGGNGSTLRGVLQRYPAMKVVVAHGKASWMQEVLEKMEASTRVIPLLHHYPVSTEPEEMWEHGNVMLGFVRLN